MFETLRNKIVAFVFKVSNKPVLFHELLYANKLFNEGMHLDGRKLGFRLRMGRAYLVFVVLAHIFIAPAALIMHDVFAAVDCHASIIIAVFFTGIVFAFFGIFREWLSDEIALSKITTAWKIHFPHFPYSDFQEKIDAIYAESQMQDIQKKELQRYILDRLIEVD
ncbi:MAG: hypothetical protein U9N30_07065 [Campylobacterota bacterium]|nr:hypothetical protein [Campylobacterota bacterium]